MRIGIFKGANCIREILSIVYLTPLWDFIFHINSSYFILLTYFERHLWFVDPVRIINFITSYSFIFEKGRIHQKLVELCCVHRWRCDRTDVLAVALKVIFRDCNLTYKRAYLMLFCVLWVSKMCTEKWCDSPVVYTSHFLQKEINVMETMNNTLFFI